MKELYSNFLKVVSLVIKQFDNYILTKFLVYIKDSKKSLKKLIKPRNYTVDDKI